jgi:hypothetical protein
MSGVLKQMFHSGQSGLPSKKEYQRYRQTGRELNHKIIEATVDRETVDYAAKRLGLRKGRQLVLDSEDDLSVLMDFALYEYRSEGKNAVERYHEEIEGSSSIEQELLEAMVTSSTSLFRVEAVSRETYSLRLCNLVSIGDEITLVDIGFSQSVVVGFLLFLRPISLENYSMTSGVVFAFPGDMENDLVREWERFAGRRSRNASAGCYAAFFKLSKRKGIPTVYV